MLVLTTYADDAWVLDAVRAGASGYLLKDTRREDLLVAIKGTAAGKTYLDPSVAGKVVRQVAAPPEPPGQPGEPLTERELQRLRADLPGLQQP